MMNILSEGKNFRLVNYDNLYILLQFLEYYLPESLKFHQTVKTYLEDHVWNFQFYVSKNWPKDPICLHFPGITQYESDDIFSSLGLFCPISKIDCLYLLLDENILIDWKKPLYIHYIHSQLMDHIEFIYRSVGTVQKKCYGDFYVQYSPNDLQLISSRIMIKNTLMHHLNKITKSYLFGRAESEFRILVKKDIPVIHNLYPAKNIESLKLFENLVERLPSYGIFVNNELAAWMIQSYYGAMISMHTKPRFRLLGFGSYVAKYLTKLVINRGYIPYVLVRSNNKISLKLYENLGFTRLYTNVRGLLKPNQH